MRQSRPGRPGEAFRDILKERARGTTHLGHLAPEVCERAMEMILSGEATPAQAAGFLLVGRAAGDSPEEIAAYTRAARNFVRKMEAPPATVTVTGGFDGKLRTFNVGAVASRVAASAGARTILPGSPGMPPKEGRTVMDAARNLGLEIPASMDAAAGSLAKHGFAAVPTEHYLPELHALFGLRWEMTRRTVLNVIEKLLSPVPDSPLMVGVTHSSSLDAVPKALVGLGTPLALVYQAIEGSDEAPLDGTSTLVLVKDGEVEDFHVEPGSVGLGKATKSDIPWQGEEDEKARIEAAISGERGAVRDLILYNAALRLWVSRGASGEDGALAGCVEEVKAASGGRSFPMAG